MFDEYEVGTIIKFNYLERFYIGIIIIKTNMCYIVDYREPLTDEQMNNAIFVNGTASEFGTRLFYVEKG